MKLLITLLTGLALSASLPAFAETTQTNGIATTSNGPDARWPGWHRGPGWRHGPGWWGHRRGYPCGPFGLYRCWDVNAGVDQGVDAE